MKLEQPGVRPANAVGTTVPKERPLAYSEREALKKEEQQLQDIKDGKELKQGVTYEAEDLVSLEKRLQNIKDIQARHSSPDLDGNRKDYLEKRAKMIEEYMHKINPTFDDFQTLRPSSGPRYSRLVQQLSRHMQDPEYQSMVRDWQDCKRELDPDNPYAGDTRLLYKE